MPLDDLKARAESGLIDLTAELAETAAERGNETTFAQLAAGGEASRAAGPAELAPEAEGLVGGDGGAVEDAGGDAEILDFARGERELGGGDVCPKRPAIFRDDGEALERSIRGMSRGTRG